MVDESPGSKNSPRVANPSLEGPRAPANGNGAAAASRELRGCLELLAKLNGELQPNGARVAINFGDITKIDINALTQEQSKALYRRLQAGMKAEIAGMTDAEIEAELVGTALRHDPDLVRTRETILFDEVTVPPGPGYETNRRYEEMDAQRRAAEGKATLERSPWRNASQFDRYRMLAAAWRRETGEDLAERLEDLGPRTVMEIDFDFAEDRDWMAWPKVHLKSVRGGSRKLETGLVPTLSASLQCNSQRRASSPRLDP